MRRIGARMRSLRFAFAWQRSQPAVNGEGKMKLTMDEVLRQARPVLPVLVIEDVALALDLACALQEGGVRVLEVTLRTPRALDAVAAIRRELPDLLVGAGTLIHTEQFQEARDAGAQFAVSPGFTERLAAAAEDACLPYLPGVMTPSEVLLALEYGYRSLKLFPADGASSVKMLKSFKGPFTGIRFCPTGGVTPDNLLSFLRLPNVACVGGTWVAPSNLVRARAWDQITQLAAEACALAASLEAQP
jgi:2-dehydro-3-deoxyphosphogluconate aldolase/(4S)-4-hydroxy-2-oxoglutarate aldolase